jgi:hypothetical protein
MIIRRSKTDQEGLRKVGMPFGGRPRTCPVRAVRDRIDCHCSRRAPCSAPSIASGLATPDQPGV